MFWTSHNTLDPSWELWVMRCSPLVPFLLHLWGICLSAWAHDQLLESWSSYCHTVISSHRNTFCISVYLPVKERWTVDRKSATKTKEINGSVSFSHLSIKGPKQKQIYFWVKSLRKIYVWFLLLLLLHFLANARFYSSCHLGMRPEEMIRRRNDTEDDSRWFLQTSNREGIWLEASSHNGHQGAVFILRDFCLRQEVNPSAYVPCLHQGHSHSCLKPFSSLYFPNIIYSFILNEAQIF